MTFEMRDEYQRRLIAEKIIRLLESEVKISPLVIDGHWGAGKTEFCCKLIHLIEDGEANLQPIYVDAFKADHADEPLMTLMAAVLRALPEADREPLVKKALPVIKFGIKTALKAGTSWLLKQDAAEVAEDFTTEIKKAGDEAINHAVESLLTDHIAVEESIVALQQALQALAEAKPIVIFIDELDRCHPDFAVNMLENIKHIFDVKGVQFVLVTNSEQLRSSINHCYGNGLDAQRYLDKFVQFSLVLSDTHKPNGYEAVLASVTHLKALINGSELMKNAGLNQENFSNFFSSLITANRLSLREIETLILYLEIYQSLTEQEDLANYVPFGFRVLRILGVFLYGFKPDLTEKIALNKINVTDIANVLGKTEPFRSWDDDDPDPADVVVAMAGVEDSSANTNFSFSEEEKQRWREFFSQRFGVSSTRHTTDLFKISIEAIEILKLKG
ncbi:MAG: P-loop NTPase fold protein [Desulfuromusa sp.]